MQKPGLLKWLVGPDILNRELVGLDANFTVQRMLEKRGAFTLYLRPLSRFGVKRQQSAQHQHCYFVSHNNYQGTSPTILKIDDWVISNPLGGRTRPQASVSADELAIRDPITTNQSF